ncbi:FkbM family methyltransferase [Chrysiogenes arsenatis]|uniref:FkbM family methyltransferase n=1 Tax=Chrysiogenes arsenatis TaxID=309797 RepID=UPI000403EA6D|nr:FkbM family methyltransferase [Chrysiogenes arsenatis]
MQFIEHLLFQAPRVDHRWLQDFNGVLAEHPTVQVCHIEKLIHDMYSTQPHIKDGYSRLAYYMLNVKEDVDTANRLFVMDAQLGRQSWFHRLKHAECIAIQGDMAGAFQQVEQIYKNHQDAVNGYASIAWRFKACPDQVESLYSLARKDIINGRITAGYMLLVAELAMLHGSTGEAAQLVEGAYRQDSTLMDGFSRCAWPFFWPQKKYSILHDWMRRDEVGKRMSPEWKLKYALVRANIGLPHDSVDLIESAYLENPSLKDGFYQLANHHYIPLKNYQTSIDFCLKDLNQNRLSQVGQAALFKLYLMTGKFDHALEILHIIDTLPTNLLIYAVKQWLDSLHWLAGSGNFSDIFISKLSSKCPKDAQLGQRALADANVEMMFVRNRLSAMSERMGIDLCAQILELSKTPHSCEATREPINFLNSKLYYASALDTLTLYKEIILNESDRFESTTDMPLIIDGGANIGTALAYFKWLYPKAHIIAFEPNPTLFKICSRNIALNNWKNIRLYPYALAEEVGTATFYCDSEMPMASSILTRSQEEGRSYSAVAVETRTLGEFIDRPIDFLKLDIEGAEKSVVTSSASSLSLVRQGLIEYHYGDASNSLSAILRVLEDCGFRYIISEPFSSKQQPDYPAIKQRWSRSIYFTQIGENQLRSVVQAKLKEFGV